MKNFNSDELMIISIYNRDNLKDTVSEIQDMRKSLEEDETDLLDLTEEVLKKLKDMSESEYLELLEYYS